MTLIEIFKRVRFVELVRPLIGIDPMAESDMMAFKEAFDLILLMTPQESDGVIIEVFTGEGDEDERRLSAWFHGRNDWEIMLSRDVKIAEDCKASDSELAAILLWELTFWGFSPEEYDCFIHCAHLKGNPFVEPYHRLRQRHHDLNCRYSEDVGTGCYTWKNDSDFYWTPKRNGPKRHRERRQRKAIDLLERNMNRWDLCESLLCKTGLKGELEAALRDEIMNGSSFQHFDMQSRTQDGNEINYLVELIRDYFPPKEGTRTVVLFSGPDRIIEDENLKLVWEALCSLGKVPAPKLIQGVNESLKNLCVDLLVFK